MKILQRNLNRNTFVVWEMKRNVSVVCVCGALNCCDTEQRSANQPACFLPDTPLCWSPCHLIEDAYTKRFLFVSVSVRVSSHRIYFKFRRNILIRGKIIKEIPGSVASGTPCIYVHTHFPCHYPFKFYDNNRETERVLYTYLVYV